ncbi:hypothetical protein [uncultured Aeromicrobium sp.]|uniref:hypothetical protein n=1 Tax=uncultured Aeromicrobium sp. TaxID=337820 RepID=UPI0025D79189|nr:hypothetical protein [uncultured Aeromicrobium sp.]
MRVQIKIEYLDRDVELNETVDTVRAMSGAVVGPEPRVFLQSVVDRAAAAVNLPHDDTAGSVLVSREDAALLDALRAKTPADAETLNQLADEVDRISEIMRRPHNELTDDEVALAKGSPLGDQLTVVMTEGRAHRVDRPRAVRALFASWLRTRADLKTLRSKDSDER